MSIPSEIRLRPLTAGDLNYHRWFNDTEVTAHNSHGIYPMTRQDCIDYIQNTKDYAMAIIAPDGLHIGNIALQNINNTYRSADLSIIIGEKDYWGKGYGKAACELMLEHAFNAMNLRRVAIGTFATNYGMLALATSLGFRDEGIRRKAAWKNGKYIDIVEFGLLREEWQDAHRSDN